MKKENKRYIASALLVLFAIVYTILVKLVDVQAVGVNGTNLGFATINTKIFNLIGENQFWYNVTYILGLVALLVIGIYGLIGVIQLIKRKSLFKVDKEIILLGIFYVVVIATYVLFEKVIINYRPILEDGIMEASYPSSHTLLAVCVFGSSIIINRKLFKNNITKIANVFLFVFIVVMVVGRLISGVHWFTDILGGVIISIALLMIYKSLISDKE